MEKHYTPEEADAILRRAVERAPLPDELSRTDLLKIAGEMGISPDVLAAAEEEVKAEVAEKSERDRFDQARRAEIRSELISYVGVIGFLSILNLIVSPGFFWAVFPMLGWGLGLFFRFMAAMYPNPDTYEDEFLKWRAKREDQLSVQGRRPKSLPPARGRP